MKKKNEHDLSNGASVVAGCWMMGVMAVVGWLAGCPALVSGATHCCKYRARAACFLACFLSTVLV